MYAQVKSTATLDSNKHTAAFHLSVDEGPLYHMGKLQLQKLIDEQKKLVRRFWDIHEGDVYDASYPKMFLKKHAKEMPPVMGWAATYTQTINDDTLVVDLNLKFQKLGERN
jgi:hypothetical protein